MSLVVQLPEAVERRLPAQAQAQGTPVEVLAASVLTSLADAIPNSQDWLTSSVRQNAGNRQHRAVFANLSGNGSPVVVFPLVAAPTYGTIEDVKEGRDPAIRGSYKGSAVRHSRSLSAAKSQKVTADIGRLLVRCARRESIRFFLRSIPNSEEACRHEGDQHRPKETVTNGYVDPLSDGINGRGDLRSRPIDAIERAS